MNVCRNINKNRTIDLLERMERATNGKGSGSDKVTGWIES